MDADPAVSADLVLVALDAPRSHPPPALPCHVTRAGPPPVGPVRSTPERTKSFFPKRRSVGPEPGRTLFFRIERTGRPAAVRPVSIPFFGSLSTSLTLPGSVPTGKHVCGLLSFIIRGNLHWLAFARPPKASIGSSWYSLLSEALGRIREARVFLNSNPYSNQSRTNSLRISSFQRPMSSHSLKPLLARPSSRRP